MEKFKAIDGPMKDKEVDSKNIVYVFWEYKDGVTKFHDYRINIETKELIYLRTKECEQ